MKHTSSICLVILFSAVLNVSVSAQQTKPSQTKVLVAPAVSEIPVLKASTSRVRKPRSTDYRSPLAIAAKEYKSNKPKRLGADQYKLLTNTPRRSKPAAGTSVQASPESVLEKLKLTPRRNYRGLGFLGYHHATHVNPSMDLVSFQGVKNLNPAFSFVFAYVQVEKGERYLVDFSVSTDKDTKFTLEVNGGSQDFGVSNGSHHLLAYLDTTEAGDVLMEIHSNTANFKFYALEITKVN